MFVIGVDPGLKGAISGYDGKKLHVIPMPIVDRYAVKKEVDWERVIDIIEHMRFEIWSDKLAYVYIEQTWSHTGQGISSTYKFGYHAGILYGIFCCMGIPITYVSPQKWKKYFGLIGKEKVESVLKAEELFPEVAQFFRGPQGGPRDGEAESALISKYGYDELVNKHE